MCFKEWGHSHRFRICPFKLLPKFKYWGFIHRWFSNSSSYPRLWGFLQPQNSKSNGETTKTRISLKVCKSLNSFFSQARKHFRIFLLKIFLVFEGAQDFYLNIFATTKDVDGSWEIYNDTNRCMSLYTFSIKMRPNFVRFLLNAFVAWACKPVGMSQKQHE